MIGTFVLGKDQRLELGTGNDRERSRPFVETDTCLKTFFSQVNALQRMEEKYIATDLGPTLIAGWRLLGCLCVQGGVVHCPVVLV